jgi:hypothetical protein
LHQYAYHCESRARLSKETGYQSHLGVRGWPNAGKALVATIVSTNTAVVVRSKILRLIACNTLLLILPLATCPWSLVSVSISTVHE